MPVVIVKTNELNLRSSLACVLDIGANSTLDKTGFAITRKAVQPTTDPVYDQSSPTSNPALVCLLRQYANMKIGTSNLHGGELTKDMNVQLMDSLNTQLHT